jgi:hypothetical protein
MAGIAIVGQMQLRQAYHASPDWSTDSEAQHHFTLSLG